MCEVQGGGLIDPSLTKLLGFLLLSMLVSSAMSAIVVRLARSQGWTDRPGLISSHQFPTPTRGGIVFVVLSTLAAIVWAFPQPSDSNYVWGWFVGLWSLAVVGFVDDVRPLPVAPRLAVHFVAAVLAVLSMSLTALPLWALAGLVVWFVWCVNFFNFMDGIDGMLASNGALICLCAALLSFLAGAASVAFFWIVIAGILLGFLTQNWAPAKIFLGDTGSGPIGFLVATGLVYCASVGIIAPMLGLILLSPLLCDASVTLVRRVWRGERWYQGHRTHAYQILSRRWGHSKVVLAWLAAWAAWVVPSALVAQSRPELAPVIAGIVVTVNCMAMFWLGAGLADAGSDQSEVPK